MNILINDQIHLPTWNNFLIENIYSSPFQSYEYYRLINSIYGFNAYAFALESNNILLSLIVVTIQKEKGIKAHFSSRAIIYGGPLIVQNDQGAIALGILLKTINLVLSKQVIYFEIRNTHSYLSYKEVFLNNNWKYIPHLNVKLNLKNKTLKEVLSGMKYNRRREISLSLKDGAFVREAHSTAEVNGLYKILQNLYITRVKLPIPEFIFFEKLFLSKIGKVFITFHNNTIIGGSFCLFTPGKSLYTLYYTGIRDYHKKIFPTHLAILGPITFCIDNKIDIFDFMGAGKPDQEYRVRDYKLEFGGILTEDGRYLKIVNSFLFFLGKLAIKLHL
jgi:serine/alanine adding enzyme